MQDAVILSCGTRHDVFMMYGPMSTKPYGAMRPQHQVRAFDMIYI